MLLINIFLWLHANIHSTTAPNTVPYLPGKASWSTEKYWLVETSQHSNANSTFLINATGISKKHFHSFLSPSVTSVSMFERDQR